MSITVMTGGEPVPTGASFGFTDFAELVDTIGLSENELLAYADGNVCLARRYVDWVDDGHEFFHAPAEYGVQHIGDFHHLAARLHRAGRLRRFDDYSLGAFAARLGRFARPGFSADPAARTFEYGYQFSRGLLVELLRKHFLCNANVQVIDSPFQIEAGPEGIENIQLAGASMVIADLFIDTREASTSNAWIVQSKRLDRVGLCPYLEFRAAQQSFKRIIHCRSASWSDTFSLAENADVQPADAQVTWQNNIIALNPQCALAPCLTLSGEDWLGRCLLIFDRLYPADFNDPLIKNEFNRLVQELSQQWRDLQSAALLLAHGDSEFYKTLANLPRSAALQWKLRVFHETGRVAQFERENIATQDWVHLLLGLGQWPRRTDILISGIPQGELEKVAEKIIQTVQTLTLRMPTVQSWHDQVVDDHVSHQRYTAIANPEKNLER